MQEMVIPMAVLSTRDDLPDGWAEPSADTPEWWFEPIEESTPTEEQVPVRPVRKSKRKPGMLFDFEEEEAQPEPIPETKTPDSTGPDWLQSLFTSDVLGAEEARWASITQGRVGPSTSGVVGRTRWQTNITSACPKDAASTVPTERCVGSDPANPQRRGVSDPREGRCV